MLGGGVLTEFKPAGRVAGVGAPERTTEVNNGELGSWVDDVEVAREQQEGGGI